MRCVCMELATSSEAAECGQTDKTAVSGWRRSFNVLQEEGKLIFLVSTFLNFLEYDSFLKK